MTYDLVIKNGMVVDGSGLPRYRADVGIKDGKIVEKGRINANGAKVIDAEGKFVAPGFVDVHTHYDAQILWDPLLTCSPWHGVTSVVMGNCGFTLAPCLPKDREYISKMFAKVEGMNRNTLDAGIDWRWEDYPSYLDRIEQEKLGINVGCMVGHSAIRRFVMGEAANEREADAGEIQKMRKVVQQAMASGAWGFTTSLSPTHYGWEGEPVPSRQASHEEVLELGSVLAEFRIGSIEIITETAVMGDDTFSEADQRLMTELSLRSGRPVNWNELSQSPDRPNVWRAQMDYMVEAAKQGAQVYAISRCQRLDINFNLQDGVSFDRWPKFAAVLSMPKEEKIEALKNTETRRVIRAEVDEVDPKQKEWRRLSNAHFGKSVTGKYAEFEGTSLPTMAKQLNKHFVDVIIDCSVEEDFRTEFVFAGIRNRDMDVVAEILRSPFAMAGISDAGAHTDRLSGSYYTTFLLQEWVREKGVLTLEEAIRRLTFMPASLYGLWDKGLIREGMAADVVIFDLDKLRWLPTERFDDFPGGALRLGNRAEGYDQLIVGGEVVFENGRHTGALPGKVLRSSTYRYQG